MLKMSHACSAMRRSASAIEQSDSSTTTGVIFADVIRFTLTSLGDGLFRARLENVSDASTLMIPGGGTTAVPLAPGVFVLHNADGPLFHDGAADMMAGLEALAEDGDPSGLAVALAGRTAYATPLAPGVAVIDNYVYNNGHKGFNLSGNWVTIARNHNERQKLREGYDPERICGWELTLDGHLETSPGGPGYISDNLARAFDLGGRNLWVHRNTFNNLGSSPGNDGEGILCQAHGGTQVYSWSVTYNDHEKGDGNSSYIGGWDVNMAGVLFGYSVTVEGAFIGSMWAYAYGFMLGAAFAFAYNVAVIPPAPPLVDWNGAEPGEES